jgi:hypothetical protein
MGCVKHINIEVGGWMRVRLDRHADPYKQLYNQRTAAERINSQAKALGIDTPKVRNLNSVVNLNILTYPVINARALQHVPKLNLEQAQAANKPIVFEISVDEAPLRRLAKECTMQTGLCKTLVMT